jgi:hypothetical protein
MCHTTLADTSRGNIVEREGPIISRLRVIPVWDYNDRRVHIRVEMTIHLHHSRLIKPGNTGLAFGIVTQVEPLCG